MNAAVTASSSDISLPQGVKVLSQGRADFFHYDWTTKNTDEKAVVSIESSADVGTSLRFQLELQAQSDSGYQSSASPAIISITLSSGARCVNVLCYAKGYGFSDSFYEGTSVPTIKKGQKVKLVDLQSSSRRKQSNRNQGELWLQIHLVLLKVTPFLTSSVPRDEIAGGLEKAFDDGVFCDAVDVLAGKIERKFSASKHMLALRSPVFKAMLTNDMEEKASNTIRCPDISPEVCKEMLSYIHTDKTPNISSFSMAEALWHPAHYYQIPDLQARCEEVLVDQVDIENAAHLLAFADQYCPKKSRFREAVISFVTQDSKTCDEVVATKDWSLVRDQKDLVYEVFTRVIKS